MQFFDGGYLGAEYDPVKLRHIVDNLKAAIPYYMKECEADAIVVTGKSGISVAFACMYAMTDFELPLIVVRKRGETTHGSPIEGNDKVDVQRYLILDDFVSSGTTVREIVARLDEVTLLRGEDRMACVGVLEYAHEVRAYPGVVELADGDRVCRFGVRNFIEDRLNAVCAKISARQGAPFRSLLTTTKECPL